MTCDGVEVTQVVQNMAHSVPLVAGKSSVVRIYLSSATPAALSVRGVLAVRNGGGPWLYVPSVGAAVINPAASGNVRMKREDIAQGLNFRLPMSATATGPCEVVLVRLESVQPSQGLVPPSNAKRSVAFGAAAPLRVHILGVRYQAPVLGHSVEPTVIDYSLIQSWLGRAYPIASVVWSKVTVDAPATWTPPFDAAVVNSFVRAIRFQDMNAGADNRTHYFGLVPDASGHYFMRGLASGIPDAAADPSTVASGPTGANGFPWDTDGSYGDWYTGHELGHTFGRFHAEFCGAVGGKPFPYANGQLSNADGEFVGLDIGDPDHNIPMAALPGVVWHDLMSYCEFQWLSDFTYKGLFDRLVAEDKLPAGPGAAGAAPKAGPGVPGGGGPSMSAGVVHVVATVNLTKSTGAIQQVVPQSEAVPSGPSPAASVQQPGLAILLKASDGRVLGEYDAPFYQDSCREPDQDETGIVDVAIPNSPDAAKLELTVAGKVVDTFQPSMRPAEVKDIRSAASAVSGLAVAAPGVVSPPTTHAVITWTDDVQAAAAALPGPLAGDTPTYIVQISTDNGATWRTVGLGMIHHYAAIDRSLLEGAKSVRVRVISTNGFQSAVSEQSFEASAL